GIDIGSREHYAAVPEDRSETSVRSFKTFTSDLYALADWLKECRIDTVVMESTGVYWIPVFQILEERGFQVCLVNARHAKNVPGRKSDVSDCQWLQRLHSFGLLSASFQPDEMTRRLRAYLRQRDGLVRYAASHIQHMQKSLTQMNIQLHNVISDITGQSGMRIIRAIIRGERNPDRLVKLCSSRLKNPIEVIKKSLQGNYLEEHLFTLTQAVELYDFYQKLILDSENRINEILGKFPDQESRAEKEISAVKKKKQQKINPEIKDHLTRMLGTDLTQVDGFNTLTVLTVVSEVGLDMSKWKTEKHFASWLGLAPNNKISGGKILQRGTVKLKSRAANALRQAAQTLSRSQSYLGAYYRKMKSRLGAGKANVASARKLAVLFYNLMKNKFDYKDLGMEYFEQKSRDRNIASLKSRAASLGLSIVESPP
ncbi:MAG TPA: IS110 family transposase, partial [Leptospiraceae bacterium]|nr:IS110 family transposase [Leptospiraceae bacterium]